MFAQIVCEIRLAAWGVRPTSRQVKRGEIDFAIVIALLNRVALGASVLARIALRDGIDVDGISWRQHIIDDWSWATHIER